MLLMAQDLLLAVSQVVLCPSIAQLVPCFTPQPPTATIVGKQLDHVLIESSCLVLKTLLYSVILILSIYRFVIIATVMIILP